MKKFIKVLAVVAAIFAVTGCSFQSVQKNEFQKVEIQDVSNSVTFRKLAEQGYMGGSLFYNPENVASGAIVPGATIAVRLGKVVRTEVDETQATFTDVQDQAQYIKLYVTDVDSDGISFTTSTFAYNGIHLYDRSFQLPTNQKLDINNDGIDDIEFKAPARKRVGLEKAIYLNFLSSQDACVTSMFAVLPEQYARSAYPSGVIGINPNGRFIYSKYDPNTTNRAAVLGLSKGDFVVDNEIGKYQKVTKSTNSRKARAIDDEVLEDVCDTDVSVQYYFEEDEFDVNCTPEGLLSVLPDSITAKYEDLKALDKLNLILADPDLVPAVAAVQETAIPEDLISEAIAQIPALTQSELVSFNRMFLEETFPANCPKLVIDEDSITEILPLAHLLLGVTEEDVEIEDVNRAVQISELSEYQKQHQALKTEFSNYKVIKKLDLNFHESNVKTTDETTDVKYKNGDVKTNVDLEKEKDISLTNLDIKTITTNKAVTTEYQADGENLPYFAIGIRGGFSNTWGNIDYTCGAAAYFEFSNEFSISGYYKTNLFNKNFKTNVVNIAIFGPIIFHVRLDCTISIPLEFTVDGKCSPTYKLYASGLYGGYINLGIKYGVEWRKKWIIRYPVIYCDGYKNSKKYNETIYFYGDDGRANATYLHSALTITPTIDLAVDANVSSVIGGTITIGTKLPMQAQLNYDYPDLSARLKIDFGIDVNARAYIGVTVCSKFFGWDWKWNIYSLPQTTLFDKEVFRRKINLEY